MAVIPVVAADQLAVREFLAAVKVLALVGACPAHRVDLPAAWAEWEWDRVVEWAA